MKSYLDASVLLRLVLEQENGLTNWREIDEPCSSALLDVECFRTMHRLRSEERIDDETLGQRYEALHALLRPVTRIDLTYHVLERASQPFPLPLKTLDAIHLASALLWRDSGVDFAFATHDRALAIAARSMGFRVIGT